MASLEELKRRIRKMEFDRMEPRILTELIKRAVEEGKSLGKELRRVRRGAERVARSLIEEDLVREAKIDDLDRYSKSFFTGIDGSNRIVRVREDEYYSMVSAAIAKFPRGIGGPVEVEFGDVQLIKIIDPSGEKVKTQTEELMLEAETKALIHFIRREINKNVRTYILLDGPIIDPPRPTNNEYVNRRVRAIVDGIDRNAMVMGYVKRIKGALFKKYVEQYLGKIIEFRSDYDLILSSMLVLNSERGDKVIHFTVPQELPYSSSDPISNAYLQYRNAGLHVYYSYSMIGTDRAPFRIDVAFREEPEEGLLDRLFRESLKAIASITPPGIRYPLPIFIAHDKVRIRKGAAETIIFEIMSRAIALDGDPILTRLKSLLFRS